MASLVKTTHTYATHGIPLRCDVYDAPDYPKDSPAVLFFHAGGLVGGGRLCVPPWLVQTCLKNKWPLVSPSYRFLPQVRGKGLLEDVTAAYEFASKLGGEDTARGVIVAGASAGSFMATLAAYYLQPAPLAMLAIAGIPSFRHKFFSSSIQLSPEPLTEEQMGRFCNPDDPPIVGLTPPHDPMCFAVEMLLPSGAKRPGHVRPAAPAAGESPYVGDEYGQQPPDGLRDYLYDYFIYQNAYPDLVGDVDPGFEWALDEEGDGAERLRAFPPTVVLQGDADVDVDKDVSLHAARCLGDRARVCLAKGQGHLFESCCFIEDETEGMDVVREAVEELESAVRASS